MMPSKQLAGLALCTLAGLGGYLWWPSPAPVAPDLREPAPVGSATGTSDTGRAKRAATVAAPMRVEAPAPVAPTPAERRTAWQDQANSIQTELIAAMLSGNAEAIARARAKAESLASTSSGR